MKIVPIALSIIVLLGCARSPQADPTYAKRQSPKIPDLAFSDLEQDKEELNKAAARLTWFLQNIQPLADRLEEEADRLEKATDPLEQQKIKAKLEALTLQINAKQREYERISAERGWKRPSSQKKAGAETE